jgi:hypothetical protein
MLEIKSSKDKVNFILELDKGNLDFRSFMFSLDDDVEKSIIKFINSEGGIVTSSELINNMVFNNAWCSRNRLFNRLESLISHNYLYKVSKNIKHGIYNKNIVCYVLRLD